MSEALKDAARKSGVRSIFVAIVCFFLVFVSLSIEAFNDSDHAGGFVFAGIAFSIMGVSILAWGGGGK